MSMTRARREASAGFTLIEMMVVIIIAAVVTAYAVPAYHNLVSQYRMSGEINDLQADLALARSAAIKAGLAVTICPSAAPAASPNGTTPACSGTANWATGWIVFTDTSGTTGNQTFNTATGDALLRAHVGLQGTDTLTSSSSNGALSAITFNRMGGTTSLGGTNPDAAATGTITLHDANNNLGLRRCVVVSETGTLTLYTPQTPQNPGTNCP